MPDRKLKVFLSSTAKDLTAFREAVHARLAASRLFECIRQEDFGAQPHPPVDLCRAQVLEADLFIGLVGMRRGWEPPDDPSRRSITEMEYDWAKDHAQRFMYVTPPDFPVPGNLRETDEEHQRQLGFRQRVLSDLVVSQEGFSSPEALALLLVDRLTDHVLKAPKTKPNDDVLGRLPDAVANRILQLLDERGELKKAEQGGLERDIVLKLAQRLKPEETLDFDRAVAELENAITIALEAIARGQRVSNENDFLNDVLKTVAKHTQTGENERAIQELDDALAELTVRESDTREKLKRWRLTLLEASISQHLLQRDAKAVAERIARVVQIENPEDSSKRLATFDRRAKYFWEEGRDKGLNSYLEVAIEIARLEVHAADTTDKRGAALNHLGITLRSLGEREAGTARLEEAVATYREALTENAREHVPFEWAMTQNNLGNALKTLGERESGTARLEEAVSAFREALKEYKRNRAPLDWATTQNNLGNALKALGERETGTARLGKAVAAHRKALKERTRERVPLDWASTQSNLGGALIALGQRESGTARLKEAVAICREALKEYTRESVPFRWASIQSTLGAALSVLGQRESGTARLEEAVIAYRDALAEHTRERAPLEWAVSTGNQGVVLMNLANRRGDAGMAAMAVSQIEQAFTVMRDAGHVPNSRFYEAQLPKARAIRDRLNKA